MGDDTVQALSKAEKIRRYGEVFTPGEIVTAMCDMLEAGDPDVFDPGTTFLEPTCGDGAMVTEVLRRKFARCRRRADYTAALRSVWAMEIQPDNVAACIANVTALCGDFFKPTKEEMEIINDHVILADSLKIMRMIAEMEGRG